MNNKKRLLGVIIFFSLAVVVSGFFLWLAANKTLNLEIGFLDVGQGDAILIKSPFGQNILIDGGPDGTILKRLGDNLSWWERTIDLMILTHPHDDHVAGLNEVIKRYDVQKIIYTGVKYSSPTYDRWQELVKDYKIPIAIVDRMQTINLGESCYLEILYPRQAIYNQSVDNLNNSSIVSRLTCDGIKILLMGDAEREEEKELIKSETDLSAEIIKIGHHGSDTATSDEFLEKVKPEIAILEVGKNDFGLPSLRVLKKLERQQIKIYRTDKDGTINIISRDGVMEIGKSN